MHLRELPRIDLALAAACLLVLLADCLVTGTAQTHPVLAVALSCAACLPLAWRSSHPLGSLAASMVALIACAVVLDTADGSVAVALLPLYSVSASGGRRRSIAVAGVMTVVLATTTVWVERAVDYRTGAVRLLLLVGALAVGDIVRTRRELRAEASGRAARDERERESDHQRRLSLERLRIARDVHDSIAHALVAINVRAGVAAHLGAAGDSREALLEIKSVSADALGDLRATLGLLRNDHEIAPTAPALDLESLPQLLERTCNAGLSAQSELSDLGGPIPASVGQAGFRIVQESLTNVLRHANARCASVRVRVRDGQLEIEVEDDGTDVPANAAGLGLRGMAERADALGGTLVAGPRAEGGWRVHALLPLTADAV